MSQLTQNFIEQMRVRLLEEKARLEVELKNLTTHLEIGSRDDDNALEAEEDDISRGITVRIAADLEKIERALAKIEDGSYGIDDEGKEISKERLEALPWADKAI